MITRLTMRSIAYSRYLSTATPMQAAKTAKPSGVIRSLTTKPMPRELPDASDPAATDATKTTAPLYSHLSCWRRSPADRRYRGT